MTPAARKLAVEAARAREAITRRNAGIVAMHTEYGASLREIADVVGLSHTAIAKILVRSSE
jgi:hypothetical protein